MKTHFTPPHGWMNDPNGTIVINGIYHLFYQYYPEGIKWGPMHWGHAESRDGITWEHKCIALYPDELGYIFSGSCILDKNNVSGLGAPGTPALIAIYTSHNPETGEQQQSIAYSTDYEHFTTYDRNPVIRNELSSPCYRKDFRDPKVFENKVLGGFSMVLAAGAGIEFYHSDNLKDWKKTGEFLLAKEGLTGICECPDCFEVKSDTGTKHILSFSLCGNAGPNIMPYFVGSFNGKTFVKEESGDELLLLDYGADNYAAVTFANTDSTIMIGWGENWTYAQDTPAGNYRGKMTCLKKTKLIHTPAGYRLSFAPIHNENAQNCCLKEGESVRLAGSLEISLSGNELTVSREKAIANKFHDCFNDAKYIIFTAKRFYEGECSLQILEEEGFYEIFADKGTLVFSINTY